MTWMIRCDISHTGWWGGWSSYQNFLCQGWDTSSTFPNITLITQLLYIITYLCCWAHSMTWMIRWDIIHTGWWVGWSSYQTFLCSGNDTSSTFPNIMLITELFYIITYLCWWAHSMTCMIKWDVSQQGDELDEAATRLSSVEDETHLPPSPT